MEDKEAQKLAKFDKQHPSSTFISVRLGGDPQDFQMRKALLSYLALHGISSKRGFLIGMAEFINKNGDNPALVMKIADYIVDDAKRAVERRLRSHKNRVPKSKGSSRGVIKQDIEELFAPTTDLFADIDESQIVEALNNPEFPTNPTNGAL